MTTTTNTAPQWAQDAANECLETVPYSGTYRQLVQDTDELAAIITKHCPEHRVEPPADVLAAIKRHTADCKAQARPETCYQSPYHDKPDLKYIDLARLRDYAIDCVAAGAEHRTAAGDRLAEELLEVCPECRSPKQSGTRNGYSCPRHREMIAAYRALPDSPERELLQRAVASLNTASLTLRAAKLCGDEFSGICDSVLDDAARLGITQG